MAQFEELTYSITGHYEQIDMLIFKLIKNRTQTTLELIVEWDLSKQTEVTGCNKAGSGNWTCVVSGEVWHEVVDVMALASNISWRDRWAHGKPWSLTKSLQIPAGLLAPLQWLNHRMANKMLLGGSSS